jgi:hypothetical protein
MHPSPRALIGAEGDKLGLWVDSLTPAPQFP